MITFPNCKINLGLNITAKRSDGYHDLSTVFYPLPLQDALEIVTSNSDKDTEFSSTGLNITGNSADNLCVKAYNLLKKHHPALPPVHIHLHKSIPMGAGLGGGSADGAFTLRLLDQYYTLGLSQQQLAAYALELGSDCPFFIYNKPCFATGRGEQMDPVSLDLGNWQFLLIHPAIHVSTAWAFSQIVPVLSEKTAREIVTQPVSTWKNLLTNDFEQPVAEKYPVIKEIKDALYDNGAIYAAMTGSGSTVFGMFPKEIILPVSSFQNHPFSIVNG